MARPTGVYVPTSLVGVREDLTDMIYNIDPFETPFMNTIGRDGKAKQFLHEWQTDSLASPAANAQISGDKASHSVPGTTTRLSNVVQIMHKSVLVADETELVDKAGRDKEMAYQTAKRMKELKTDMEYALIGVHQAQAKETASAAPKLGSVGSFIKTNSSAGTSGSDPATADGKATRTDGTQRAFTEAQVKEVVRECWTNGGQPDCLVVSAVNKQKFSTFTGTATKYRMQKEKTIIATADVYESDFGMLQVIPSRILRARDAYVYQKSMWSLAFLSGVATKELATEGAYERRLVTVRFTLEAKNEKSSGIIADLTTS